MNGEDVFRSALPRSRNIAGAVHHRLRDIDQAVRLMRAGADDYVDQAVRHRRLLERDRGCWRGAARDEEAVPWGSPAPCGASMSCCGASPISIARVLFTGESGVGKEVAARFLHKVPPGAVVPFIAVNCAAIPGSCMESELFGHERGSFTGAHSAAHGYVERAPAASCSWTRSVSCRYRCNRSCCACSRPRLPAHRWRRAD